MPEPHSKPFTKKRLLVVEGKDDINFSEKLLEYIGILDSVDIRSSEGKDNLKNLMPAFKFTTGFKNIEKIAVLWDADKNARDAFKQVTDVLKKIGLPSPKKPGEFSSGSPSVGIFIMPDNSSNGMLEDLCLESVKDHEAMKCVDNFIACTQELKEQPDNISKAKVQVFLASRSKIANSIGRAAQKGYWNFNSEKLQPLINFLKQLK
jgi:hypothetical protein